MSYSGASKDEFCNRLVGNWKRLADRLEIPPAEQHRFEQGDEGRGIWAWLELRGELRKLPAALTEIGLGELADDLNERRQTDARHYYQSRIEHWSQDRFKLDRCFVRLRLWLDQGEDAAGQRWQAQARQFEDLQTVLAEARDYPALVLLGPPGSGKSTLLGHLELEYARQALALDADGLATAPLTFFIPLNLYKSDKAGAAPPSPRDWLAQQWQFRCPELPSLDAVLRERRLLLLLDALNEMPHQRTEHIEAWQDFLQRLVEERPGNRVLFSCRTHDYGAKLSSKTLAVPQVRIEALTDAQVREFLERYCPAATAGRLWDEFRHNPRQLELYRSPYYLALLVDQLGPDGGLPEGRAALFSGFVRRALHREIGAGHPLFKPDRLLTQGDCERLAQDGFAGCDLPGEGRLFPALGTLAYRMQETTRSPEASQVRIAESQAFSLLMAPNSPTRGFLARLRDRLTGRQAQNGLERDCAEAVLQAGLALRIVERDVQRREVLFYHQLLQEYFAARLLALQPDSRLVRSAWRIGQVKPTLVATLKELPDSEPLPPLPTTGWEETTVLMAAMTAAPEAFIGELMKANLPLAGRCAAQPDVRISVALKERIHRALVERTQDVKADLRARIAAGLALGELGDPRFERRQGPYGDYLLPPLVAIAGGTYPIGSDEGHYDDESPMHTVELAPFQIGKFPVTNAEWVLFMQAGGYEDERWWETAAAKAWRRGEGTTEGPKQELREFREQLQANFEAFCSRSDVTSADVENAKAIVQMSDAEFESHLDRIYSSEVQTQPSYWNDDVFNNPAQPVVGIG
ncbi:MAG: SUMF1/EgtB/PvdO family nonheme iron enzyme [Candidatus Competibacteraceae bacterium]